MNAAIDKDLLLLIAQGNEEAYRQLFNVYLPKLTAYLNPIIKFPAVAEEVAMDVLTKIWLARDMLPQVQNIDAFFFRIARNKAIDYLRSVANKPEIQDETYIHAQELTESEMADYQLCQREFNTALMNAINMLSPQRKKIFLLSREAGMTHEQISKLTGLSKATINNHLTDAQKFLRTHLLQQVDIITLLIFLHKIH